MKETFLTRHDEGVGEGEYDSIAWAFEVHVGSPDDPTINSAVLYGNEDAPFRIDFYESSDPTIEMIPAIVWKREVE